MKQGAAVEPAAPGSTGARRLAVTLAAGGALLIVTIALALVIGGEPVDLRAALADLDSPDARVLLRARLPRVLLAALIGCALAPAGVAFQALLRNPLADPYVLGVSGGATVAGAGSIVLLAMAGKGPQSGFFRLGDWTLPLASFLGALAAIWVVFACGTRRGRFVPGLALLVGVVLNTFCGALILLLATFAPGEVEREALSWLNGSLGTPSYGQVVAVAVLVLAAVTVLAACSPAMNAMAFGETTARIVGIDAERSRRAIFGAASLATGAAVAFTGPIGFVGVLVPHLMRLAVGPDHRGLLAASALGGAVFMVLSDLLARASFALIAAEVPAGTATVIAGAPFFLVALARSGAGRR